MNTTRPLKKRVAKPIEPVRVLKSDERSVRVEDEPRDAEMFLTNPLVSEPAREIEAVRFRKSESFSPEVEIRPMEADS